MSARKLYLLAFTLVNTAAVQNATPALTMAVSADTAVCAQPRVLLLLRTDTAPLALALLAPTVSLFAAARVVEADWALAL